MKYKTTLTLDNTIKQITLTPAIYMDTPLWEVTLDHKVYMIKKEDHGWVQRPENGLNSETLTALENLIENLNLKKTG